MEQDQHIPKRQAAAQKVVAMAGRRRAAPVVAAGEIDSPAPGPGARVLPSKLAVPMASPSLLPRERLVQAMLEPGRARLVVVRAAAGFGKTTLLQQYQSAARAAGRGVLWLNLDAADNDLHRFVAHLSAGFEAMRAGQTHAPDAPGESAAEGPTGTQPDLVERVAACDAPFAIVLDEFEVIQDESVLHYVQQLLDALPPQAALLIASRTTPDIGLGRIRARGQLLEIGPTALRFSLDEAAAYLREKQHLPLRDNEIATLHRCTEGWAAAIYLASLSLHTRTDHAAFVSSFSGSNLELAQYLAEDILARQDEASREFLLQTSVLDQMCAGLCDAITGRSDSQRMIEQLERANLFIFRLDPEGNWYRYHSLFSSFLRDQLQRLHPGRAQVLHRAAAAWYVDMDRPIPAVEHLLRAGAETEAVELIAQCVRELQEAGRVRLLVRWFDRLSAAALAERPQLGLAYAWALALNRRHDDAMRVLGGMLDAPHPEPLRKQLALEAETIRCVVLSTTDRVEEGYAAGLAHIDHLPLDHAFQYGVLANSLAYCMIATYRYDEARRVLSRVMQREAKRTSSVMRSVADAIEAIIELLQGRLGNALARLQTAAARHWDLGQGEATGTGGKTSVDVPLAQALYECDALDEAERILADALPFAKSNGPSDSLIIGHRLMARLAYLRGDRDLALRTLAELEQIGRQHAGARVVCSAWLERARLATLEGRFDAAEQALRSAELHSQWVRPGVSMHANDVDMPFIARARLRIAQGDCADLPAVLGDAVARAGAVQRHRCALKLQILRAMAFDRLGREQEAIAALTEALRAASHEGFVRTFLDEGEGLGRLMLRWAGATQARGAAAGIAPHFVESLLDKLGPAPAEPPANAEGLSARELEVLRLLALGLRNKAIAEKLFLSEFTVKSHLRNINAKLGAQGRTEAVAIARSRGLIG